MCKKRIIAAIVTFLLMTGCAAQNTEDVNIPQEEKEKKAIVKWFIENMTDEKEFTDVKDYQYYARAVGLEKDGLLYPDMWEIYYNEDININREIDEKAVYLIRLNPERLLEVYAANNNSTPEKICSELSVTPEQFYYNFGYTATAVDYAKNHKNNIASYSESESGIFGADNSENRKTVFSTHILTIDTGNKNTVKYSSEIPDLEIRQRDLLRSTTKFSCDYSSYTDGEKSPAFYVNGIGIRRVLPLSVPNGYMSAADTDITVMFNQSPFSYGCTDDDKISLFETESEVSE